MPVYEIEGPDGTIFELEGDTPPTEQELEQVFAQYNKEPVGLQNIPYTTQQQDYQQSRVDKFESMPEEKKAEFAKGLASGIQSGFEELGVADDITRQSDRVKADRKKEFAEKEKRRAKGKLTTEEKLLDVAFTEDVTRDPSVAVDQSVVGGAKAVVGAVGILPRALGSVVQKFRTGEFGDISKEETKAFKQEIQAINDWAESRENTNERADEYIDKISSNFRKAVLDGSLSEEQLNKMSSVIDKLEDQKTSGVLTTAGDVVGNILFETLSDPLVLKGLIGGVVKGVSRAIPKEIGEKFAKEYTAKTLDRLSNLGVKSKKMLEYISSKEGDTFREKLANIRLNQPVRTSPSGVALPEDITRELTSETLETLKKNADEIDEILTSTKKESKDAITELETDIATNKENVKSEFDVKESDVRAKAEQERFATKSDIESTKEDIISETEYEKDIIGEVASPEGTVEKFTRGGEFSGRDINKAFKKAEELAGEARIYDNDKKALLNEMIAAIEGDADRVADYSDVVSEIWKIKKNAPLGDYRRKLTENGLNPNFAESFRNIKKGDIDSVKKAKKEFNDIIQSEYSLGTAMSKSSENFKKKIDEIVENNLTPENYKKLKGLEEEGGKFRDALKSIHEAMGIKGGTEIISDIKLGDAISKLDEYFDKQAKILASKGSLSNMGPNGRYSKWKEYFGIDAGQEIINRAKKLGLSERAKKTISYLDKKATKTLGEIDVKESALISALNKQKQTKLSFIDKLKKAEKGKLQSIYDSKINEIKKELARAKSKVSASENVAEDFRKAVEHFADKGQFEVDNVYREFESKYGSQLAKLIPDQAVLSSLDITAKGKIKDAIEKTNMFLKGYFPSDAFQKAKFAEGASQRIVNFLRPYDERIDKIVERIKKSNKEVARELNRIKKRNPGASTDKTVEYLIKNQPFFTMDLVNQEFKNFDVTDFIDEATILGVANGTIRGVTNRERASAKRLEKRLNSK